MARKEETPFHKIMLTRSKLDLYLRYGEAALGDQLLPEFLTDVRDSLECLMTFRNIVNGMVALDDDPSKAVIPYLSNDVIREAAETIDAR